MRPTRPTFRTSAVLALALTSTACGAAAPERAQPSPAAPSATAAPSQTPSRAAAVNPLPAEDLGRHLSTVAAQEGPVSMVTILEVGDQEAHSTWTTALGPDVAATGEVQVGGDIVHTAYVEGALYVRAVPAERMLSDPPETWQQVVPAVAPLSDPDLADEIALARWSTALAPSAGVLAEGRYSFEGPGGNDGSLARYSGTIPVETFRAHVPAELLSTELSAAEPVLVNVVLDAAGLPTQVTFNLTVDSQPVFVAHLFTVWGVDDEPAAPRVGTVDG